MNSSPPPCAGQTPDSVETWLRTHVCIGTTLAIRDTHGGFLAYKRAVVTRLGRGRFEVDAQGQSGGSTFYYSGKNCFQPKGRTRLVEPTDAVLAACDTPGVIRRITPDLTL